MGKNLQQQESIISLQHGNPGCMKGIFHHLNHRKWYHVKKRLSHKRNNGGKHATAVEDHVNSLNTTNAGEVPERLEAEVTKSSSHGKSSESGSGHKSSMKSRIKALISEEVYKRKGRHHRSSSYPTRMPLDRSPSIHHLDVSGLDPHAETGLCNESLDQQDNLHSLVSSLLDPLLPRICGESVATGETCSLCAAMHAKNYLRQNEVNELGNQPVKDHTLLQDEFVYAIEPSKIASLQESKLFFDALDLLNIRKELFLKVLQDPNSSLSHHLHNQRALTSRLGLTKSVSFPTAGSSGRTAPLSNSHKPQVCTKDVNAFTSSEDSQENLVMETGTCADGETPTQPLLRPDSLDNASLGSSKEFNRQHVNKLIMKRFKNLREKIKHAIKESRKERQRIVMDGVLHKIPYGYPKNVKEEGDMPNDIVRQNWCKYSPGDGSRNDQFFVVGNSQPDIIRRTASFNEPLSRYNRLLELCFNKEANNHISDGSSLRTAGGSPASMARILSLPDLRSYSFSGMERLPATNSLEMSMKSALSGSSSAEISSLVNKKLVALKNKVPLGDSSGNDSRENIHDFGESNDLGSFERRKSIDDQDGGVEPISDMVHGSKMEEDAAAREPAMSSTVEDSELAQELERQAKDLIPYKEDSSLNQLHELSVDSPGLLETNSKANERLTPQRQPYNDLLHIQVDMKNRADFDYVRDVLELSGFIGTEFLGKWHSDEQPVDPLVFDEVEGCLLAQPDCSGNEEGGSCNHLPLFDLINEVLLEIYGRTFSYWPKLLTCCSQVHPMPVGYHVLEDVWASINWYLSWRPVVDPSLDDAVNHDLSKSDGWMNVQFEAECVGIEVEDLIFDDLVEELVLS